jgi:hypothetical protein
MFVCRALSPHIAQRIILLVLYSLMRGFPLGELSSRLGDKVVSEFGISCIDTGGDVQLGT